LPLKRLLWLGLLLLGACASDGSGEGPVVLSGRGPHPASNGDAALVVLEYADLQCTACRGAQATIVAPLLAQYGARIRYEFQHFPLMSVHPLALEAAEAAECAGDQGKFWEYTDLAFAKQSEMSRESLSAWARELSLDETRFEQCLASEEKRTSVIAEYKEGLRMGVEGTPTFFVNGKKVAGRLPALQQAIEAGLADVGRESEPRFDP
jgi:protein-disulfide isomerase